ncbi:hypothetical protein HN615_10130 [Candidatus Woesearchaeota archaeon]|jgi:hypothetical protein|nr:hypothetical protein [Candidatus Woesearchaeota archaeon]
MEEELHIERHGSSRKSKRFANKRERLQVKNYLKGKSSEYFVDETDDEDIEYEEIPYKN